MAHRGWVPKWGYVNSCSGSETAAYFGVGLITSYLFLFIDFYIRTYKGSSAKTAKANGKANVKKKDGIDATIYSDTGVAWLRVRRNR
jgi:hypothetical protein